MGVWDTSSEHCLSAHSIQLSFSREFRRNCNLIVEIYAASSILRLLRWTISHSHSFSIIPSSILWALITFSCRFVPQFHQFSPPLHLHFLGTLHFSHYAMAVFRLRCNCNWMRQLVIIPLVLHLLYSAHNAVREQRAIEAQRLEVSLPILCDRFFHKSTDLDFLLRIRRSFTQPH